MKILFITHYDNLYGANNALLKLITGLKNNGDTPIVIIPAKGQFSDCLKNENIEYIISAITQWQAVYTTPLRFMFKKAKRVKQIKREIDFIYNQIREMNVDLIHSNSSVILHGAVLAKMINCRHIWHIREFSKEHFNMRYFYKKSIVKDYYESADALITISDALRNNYREKYKNANVIRIYDGVSADEEPERDYDNQLTHFVYVGYLFKMKHQLEVIKACEKLYNQGYTAFEMHFIGDGKSDYKNKLKKEIARSGLCNIYLDGYVSDVNEKLKEMDVGIIASEYEAFGLVTVEYMLNAMPVLGRIGGGTSEIVKDTETGFLYSNEDEMVMAMKKIMEDNSLRRKMGTAGYRRAKAYFSEENNVKAISSLYRSIISEEI